MHQISFSKSKIEELTKIALTTHKKWDDSWLTIQEEIKAQGHCISCYQGCSDCCFTRKFCSLSEGLLIADYMEKRFSPERFEYFRLRVESANSSLKKLRDDEVCDSESTFFRCGGVECPFLEKRSCSIYSVRPLDCRTLYVTSQVTHDQCRQCPRSVCCIEAEAKNVQLQKEIREKEESFELPSLFDRGARPMISEVLSFLWEKGVPASTYQVTEKSWKTRLESCGSVFDQTWQDDRFDFRILKTPPLVLPEEGEHSPDLVVLKINPEPHQLYNESVKTNMLSELRVLYKLLPGGYFDWDKKVFCLKGDKKSEESHIVWMGDSIQERLMMWEAAKRCRGKVLCGGLGMGIFPQYALCLPRVESVHIVDMDKDVILLIKKTWNEKAWPRMSDCTMTQSQIEVFLQKTKEKFDTIYIDTWDALTEEYLPHVNHLRKLSEGLLKPGGEMIFWGYDLMLRLYLNQAKNILKRRDYFLGADEWQMKTLSKQIPLFHRLLSWFKEHSRCSDDELYSEAYQLALVTCQDLGVLSLNNHPGFSGGL